MERADPLRSPLPAFGLEEAGTVAEQVFGVRGSLSPLPSERDRNFRLEDGRGPGPSRHPERRRAHLTVIVGDEGVRDGVDVSVLRYGDGEPAVLRGGAGLIHLRLLRCWSRRPDAPWATQRSDRVA